MENIRHKYLIQDSTNGAYSFNNRGWCGGAFKVKQYNSNVKYTFYMAYLQCSRNYSTNTICYNSSLTIFSALLKRLLTIDDLDLGLSLAI